MQAEFPVQMQGKQLSAHVKQLIVAESNHISSGLVLLDGEFCHKSSKSLLDIRHQASKPAVEVVLLTSPARSANASEFLPSAI